MLLRDHSPRRRRSSDSDGAPGASGLAGDSLLHEERPIVPARTTLARQALDLDLSGPGGRIRASGPGRARRSDQPPPVQPLDAPPAVRAMGRYGLLYALARRRFRPAEL